MWDLATYSAEDPTRFEVTGPDRTLWLALNQANAVARLTLNGNVSLFLLPTDGAAPVGIAAGPDGALWVAMESGSIVRVER